MLNSAEASVLVRVQLLLLLLLLSAAGGGCSEPDKALKDDEGRSVRVKARPARVVSLAPNLTEILFAIGSGSMVVGIDDHSNYPAQVRGLPKLGGMTTNLERLVALRPDIVLMSTNAAQPSLVPALNKLGIPVYIVRTERASEIGPAMRRIGAILRSEGSESAALRFERSLAAQRRVRKPVPKVLFLVWAQPLFVAGRGTFVDDLFRASGVQNVVPDAVTGWPQYAVESLLANPPDLIIYPAGAGRVDGIAQALASDSRLRDLTAVRLERYYAVDEDLFSRPGPRLPEAASALNQVLDRWQR